MVTTAASPSGFYNDDTVASRDGSTGNMKDADKQRLYKLTMKR